MTYASAIGSTGSCGSSFQRGQTDFEQPSRTLSYYSYIRNPRISYRWSIQKESWNKGRTIKDSITWTNGHENNHPFTKHCDQAWGPGGIVCNLGPFRSCLGESGMHTTAAIRAWIPEAMDLDGSLSFDTEHQEIPPLIPLRTTLRLVVLQQKLYRNDVVVTFSPRLPLTTGELMPYAKRSLYFQSFRQFCSHI